MVDPEDFEFDEGDVFTDGSAVGVGWDEVEECGAAAIQFDKGQCHVVRMRIGALPAAAVCAEHVGLLLAQRYSRAGTRVISDCQAVIQGFQKWRGGGGAGLEYRNPYGGKWAQMGAIEVERGLGQIVTAMVKIKAHQTKEQAAANGDAGLYLFRGNEKADIEAGHAAGAMERVEREAYLKQLEGKVRRLRLLAKALHKMAWTDTKMAGLKKAGPKAVKTLPRMEDHGMVWWQGRNKWGCGKCGRWAEGDKGGARKRLQKKKCVSEGLLADVDGSHQVWLGWIDGCFSMAFCTKCGRWRTSAGRGLLGPCDPGRQRARLPRLRQGKHPVTGIKFERITRPGRLLEVGAGNFGQVFDEGPGLKGEEASRVDEGRDGGWIGSCDQPQASWGFDDDDGDPAPEEGCEGDDFGGPMSWVR